MTIIRSLILTLLTLCIGLEVAASEQRWQDRDQPLLIDSGSMELMTREGVARFTNGVVARQGELTLQAETVETKIDLETQQIRSVVAVGEVRVKKGDVVAAGGHGEYDVETGVVVITDNPKIWRGRDGIGGSRIFFYLDDERVVVEDAKATLHPPTDKGEKE